jgi:7-cyano-7-deazaguanine synthase
MTARPLVLLSGGLDSTVCLALAQRDAEQPPLAVSFDYGQRHRRELERSAAIADLLGCERSVVSFDAGQWGGSALTDGAIEVPDFEPGRTGIPVTYVPARNTIFLAFALAIAEARHLDSIYIGVNALDYSGYPDCRPEFLAAFSEVARLGTAGASIEIRAPLVAMTKAEIVSLGIQLAAPLELTWSCYRSGVEPCQRCDSCRLRARGFAEAGIADPAGVRHA